ncbi:methyl-accepting chemotaxis protein, partial [Steroidobacter sp.]|uniref:methyl-accepting chemotaxis protein n=1 Tax=Steroidobacter sp. TaxID=1978227 RepID=UPI0025D84872
IAARNLVLVTKPQDIEAEHAAVVQAHQDVTSLLEQLERTATHQSGTDETRTLISNIKRVESQYGPVALNIVQLAMDPATRALAIQKMNEQCRPLLAALIRSTDEFADYTKRRGIELTKDSQAEYASQKQQLLAICIVAFLVATALGTLIVHKLTRALGAEPNDLRVAAERVASGDLSPLTDGRSVANDGSLMASLSAMQASLANIVGEVRSASDAIAVESERIASGNAKISERTDQQASALQQTSATMSQLGTTVERNSQSAQQARELASNASSIASKGSAVMTEVVATMQDINAGSNKIGEIVGVIDSIAFQTNMLALNGAVEAARAGEHGLGFAVVAGEVRSLAKRSAAAANEIKALIAESTTRVERGSEMVDRAGHTMAEILEAIRDVNNIMGEISAASIEQSTGIVQVGSAVTQMDRSTRQNASIVEQSAAAAEALSDRAQRLVGTVGVFKLAS